MSLRCYWVSLSAEFTSWVPWLCTTQMVGPEESWWSLLLQESGSSVRCLLLGSQCQFQRSHVLLVWRYRFLSFYTRLQDASRWRENAEYLPGIEKRHHVLHPSPHYMDIVLQYHLQSSQDAENGKPNTLFTPPTRTRQFVLSCLVRVGGVNRIGVFLREQWFYQ